MKKNKFIIFIIVISYLIGACACANQVVRIMLVQEETQEKADSSNETEIVDQLEKCITYIKNLTAALCLMYCISVAVFLMPWPASANQKLKKKKKRKMENFS